MTTAARTRVPHTIAVLEPWLAPLRVADRDPLGNDRITARRAWQALCDAGIGGVLVPVRRGGQGLGMLEAVRVAEDITALGVALPFLASAVFATSVAIAAGADGLLSELATGDRVATVVLGGQLSGTGAGLTLSGQLTDVLHGSDADTWLVLAREESGQEALVLLKRPDFDVVPTRDWTRPVVQARVASAPVTLFAASASAMVADAAACAELIRCAEVCRAAERVLADDEAAQSLLEAASSLVRHAAAVADVDGRPDLGLVSAASAWVERMAALAPEGAPLGDTWSWVRTRHASTWNEMRRAE